ncbi:hypothetical protein HDU79_000075 [Rhizoclosmatium sp. JEL0117]|nr:hypothetical protein HDU79_000075 [Rhizoclosmatium sp. JEL0117]
MTKPPTAPPLSELPPAYTSNVAEDARLAAFASLVGRHEISHLMAKKLRRLEAYDIVVIADDSGSMNTPVTANLASAFAPAPTRWDELKATVSTVTDIAATLDSDGIDVFFLNREPVRNVTGPSAALDAAFAPRPGGYTPITRVLREVLAEKWLSVNQADRKKLLILIATDGQPTTDSGQLDHQALKHVLMYERGGPGQVPVAFLVCTDDDDEIEYLNEWDNSIRDLDVIDDYHTERKQILGIQGKGFPFSRGDWVCKMLLGAIDPEIDALDEFPVHLMREGVTRASTTQSSLRRQDSCEIQ